METNLNIPEELTKKINAYLQAHPEESLEEIIEDALAMRRCLPEKPEALLTLAGIVQEVSCHAANHAEDKQN